MATHDAIVLLFAQEEAEFAYGVQGGPTSLHKKQNRGQTTFAYRKK
jgi:hypothetical protein